jgi:hypothetical protein
MIRWCDPWEFSLRCATAIGLAAIAAAIGGA